MSDRSPLVVGFDLDMTLVDSRPGIAATIAALAAETGTRIDADVVVGRLGPPLEDEMAHWFPSDAVPAVSDRFRELYADVGVPGTVLLDGAAESVAAVRSAGGGVVVVTAKFESNAVACLDHVGLAVDAVCGWRHGPDKGLALAEHGATVYVGDTPSRRRRGAGRGDRGGWRRHRPASRRGAPRRRCRHGAGLAHRVPSLAADVAGGLTRRPSVVSVS